MKEYTLPTGSKMPALGFGTSRLVEDQLETAILTALKVGFRHFDTAAIYGNEQAIGAALKKGMKTYSRRELWITSKLWCDVHAPEDVLPALKNSLAQLHLDYIDLYLMHFPVALTRGVSWPEKQEDYQTLDDIPLHATWQAMEECVKKGLIKDIGVSNFSTKKLHDLFETATIQPAVNQIEIHPYQQQHAQRDFAKRHNITLTAYAPLGSKGFTLHRADGTELPPLLTHPVIAKIADEHNATTAQILLAWLLALEISAIPRSSSPERIQENCEASELTLTPQDMVDISELHAKAKIFDAKPFTEHGSPYTLENIWDGELYT